jgi:hypothetical protein
MVKTEQKKTPVSQFMKRLSPILKINATSANKNWNEEKKLKALKKKIQQMKKNQPRAESKSLDNKIENLFRDMKLGGKRKTRRKKRRRRRKNTRKKKRKKKKSRKRKSR